MVWFGRKEDTKRSRSEGDRDSKARVRVTIRVEVKDRLGFFLCIKGLGYQEARLANICSCVAGAHCDEVDENPEASRQ